MTKLSEIDTEVRDVTPVGANLFAELCFAGEEVEQLQTTLRHEIDQAQQLKRQLMDELVAWVSEQQCSGGSLPHDG